MNWEQIQGDWTQFTGKVKEKWGKLTDDELTEIAGRREHFIDRLRDKYGYEKERAEKDLSEFIASLKSETAPAGK
jgi:uncharacterized protein YjbJ (UPF0337 family)